MVHRSACTLIAAFSHTNLVIVTVRLLRTLVIVQFGYKYDVPGGTSKAEIVDIVAIVTPKFQRADAV